jgi:thiol-disulfide isomerase/thioredoxin
LRVLGVLALLGAMAALALFLLPILRPDVVPVAPKATSSAYRRGRVVAVAASKAPTPDVSVDASPEVDSRPHDVRRPDGRRAETVRPRDAAEATEASAGAGPLCDRLLEPGQGPRVALPRGQTLRGAAPEGPRGWRWVNLWAAWCKPCIEEMPVLQAWAHELGRRAPHITYLSIDDDERQLRRFLAGAGRELDGHVTWVEEEAARAAFFEALELPNPPTLPAQVILDPAGRVRCVRVGSISRRELDKASRDFAW